MVRDVSSAGEMAAKVGRKAAAGANFFRKTQPDCPGLRDWGNTPILSHKKFHAMTIMRSALGALITCFALSWWACNKDITPEGPGKIVDVAFAGRVVDEAGAGLEGAQVRVGGELALTDANGVFRTKAVPLPNNNARINAYKIGYFDFSRAYYVEDGAGQTLTIQLLRKIQVGSFQNSTGGTVNVPGGPTLKFPAGATDGTGIVRVFARYLPPSDPNLHLRMPGDLRAIDADNQERVLATFGMIAVELSSASGDTRMAAGKEAEISIPIDPTQAASAPTEMPLWHFDLEKARWIEEGKAQKIGNQYVGMVSHFSWWNCDIPLPLVTISGKVLLEGSQTPLANTYVAFTYDNYSGKCHGYTDLNGCFTGAVPADVPLTINVYPSACSQTPAYTATVGPFNTTNNTLPPIWWMPAPWTSSRCTAGW
jgi:hypothetical protein